MEEPAMELILLTVPGCPNAAAFEERLAAALAGQPGVTVTRRDIAGGACQVVGSVALSVVTSCSEVSR
jgi:hypothetical protein